MINVRCKLLLCSILIILFIVDTAWPISNKGFVDSDIQVPTSLIGGRESPGALAEDKDSSDDDAHRQAPIDPLPVNTNDGPSEQPLQKNESIKVVKVISPLTNKTGPRMGDISKVSVEIQSIVNDSITISVREIINEDLRIFKSTEHGYILSNEDDFCYYKLGFLDDLENGRLKATIKNNNEERLFFNKGNCSISACELQVADYSFIEPCILIWPPKKNDSLKNGYSGLREFLENRMAFNKSRIDNLTINRTEDINVSIRNNDVDILRIVNNETCIMDRCPVLLWNNIPHHLEFKKINNTRHIYDTLNVLAFDDIELGPYSTFVFWYHVMPNDPGIYDTETLVTLKEAQNNKSIASHLKLNILEDNPQFNVHRKFNKNQIYKNDELEFEFDVDYRGGGDEPEIKNISVRFNPSNDYKYIRIDGRDINMDGKKIPNGNQLLEFSKNFVKDKTVPISVTIKFNKTGVLSPPSIWIDNRHFIFDETATNVIVDIPFWRYFTLINLLLVTISTGLLFLAKDIYLETGGRREELMKKIKFFSESLIGAIIKILLIFSVPLICIALIRWLFKI